jgi:predicted RNA-binding Zn-ribbon protein involved in translation (DUF1610 family)
MNKKYLKICTTCGKDIPEKTGYYTEDVPNEGYSVIWSASNREDYYDVSNQNYCSIDCLIADIKKHLGCE